MPTPTPHKPTALTIKNAAADVPRMITGAGKACDGEWGLLMFPQQAVARLG